MVRYITEPKVYLVSRPSLAWGEVSRFLIDQEYPNMSESLRSFGANDAGAMVVELAARLCYGSYGKGRPDIGSFINNILESGHGSVLEHVNYGVIVTGVSRSLTHEWVRHRAGWAYSQRSQRYVDESNLTVVIPPIFQELQEEDIFKEAVESLEHLYGQVYDNLDAQVFREPESRTERRKGLRQASRAVLPNAAETQIYVTGNVRAWRHFLELRGSRYADAEIRRLAVALANVLKEESPLLFGDVEVGSLSGDTETGVEVRFSKV